MHSYGETRRLYITIPREGQAPSLHPATPHPPVPTKAIVKRKAENYEKTLVSKFTSLSTHNVALRRSWSTRADRCNTCAAGVRASSEAGAHIICPAKQRAGSFHAQAVLWQQDHLAAYRLIC